MSEPKFKPGEAAEYLPPRHAHGLSGAYTIVALLPERDGAFEYRIKHSKESYERVAKESELRKLGA